MGSWLLHRIAHVYEPTQTFISKSLAYSKYFNEICHEMVHK